MAQAQTYALHETLELHEIAVMKTVCLTKSKLMKPLVSDAKLADILQQDIETTSRQLNELSALLNKAVQ